MFLIGITFNDHSEVPETGSTWGLLFLSLIGLLGATRLRSLSQPNEITAVCTHSYFSKVAAGCAADWRSRSDVDRTTIDCSVFGPAAKPITLFGVAILTFQSPAVARGGQLDLISRSSPDEATDTVHVFLLCVDITDNCLG